MSKQMKIYICFIIGLFCINCRYCISKQCNDDVEKSVFTPVLTDKIKDFITYADSIFTDEGERKLCYTLLFYEDDENFILQMSTDFFYRKQYIKGYTFINDHLIVYDGNFANQKQYLLDTSRLIKFVDTIPGYRSDIFIDMDYEVVKREYLISNKDSLSLIVSGYY